MFIRWERRQRSRWRRPQKDYRLVAKLVESYRVEGKPRQRLVCYLGSIGENQLSYHFPRLGFWRSSISNLDQIKLSPEQRQAIEAALHERVARPTAQSKREALDLLAEVTKRIQGNL